VGVARPVLKGNGVLVKIRASTVTAGDRRMRKADPLAARFYNGPTRKKGVTIPGLELAWGVEAAGKKAPLYAKGHPVFAFAGPMPAT
jgi:NADPH:quinone reductase-like Zn-dependent oxidoreductase